MFGGPLCKLGQSVRLEVPGQLVFLKGAGRRDGNHGSGLARIPLRMGLRSKETLRKVPNL